MTVDEIQEEIHLKLLAIINWDLEYDEKKLDFLYSVTKYLNLLSFLKNLLEVEDTGDYSPPIIDPQFELSLKPSSDSNKPGSVIIDSLHYEKIRDWLEEDERS